MSISKRILKILRQCDNCIVETAKLEDILREDCLAFNRHVTIAELRNLNLLSIIAELRNVTTDENALIAIINNIDRIPTACIPSDDFV